MMNEPFSFPGHNEPDIDDDDEQHNGAYAQRGENYNCIICSIQP